MSGINTKKREICTMTDKTEAEKSLRGTVTLYKDPSLGLIIYLRGKKIFMRDPGKTWAPTSEIDFIEAAYRIRREYADSISGKREVTIFPSFRRCKTAAEISVKLEKMVVPSAAKHKKRA